MRSSLRAIFDAFSIEEDDLIVRTIIGTMMGMLPMVYLNVVLALTQWRANDNAGLNGLRALLKQEDGKAGYERARQILLGPLMRAMQRTLMPPRVWRIVAGDHELGGRCLRKGNTVDVNISMATNEDLERGVTDVTAVFGGDRSSSPHPTHACPGFQAALGIMLGVQSRGVMESV